MRKIFAFITSICVIFSCTMEDVSIPTTNDAANDIFYAAFEDYSVESRTYLDQNVKLLWHEDDRISLFRSTLNEQFRFTGKTGDNSGGFSLIENDDWVTGNEISTNYAVYPYDASIQLSNEEVIHLNMPSVQNYAENSFGRGANTMVAASENSSSKFLPFRNLGGYLIIKLYGENTTVKSIVLEGNNNEVLAGPATAEARYGYLPIVNMSADGTGSITLDCGEGVGLGASADTPVQFWIVVPPVTFEKGFTLTITDINDNVITKSTSKSQTIVRNEVKSMAGFAVAFEGEGEDPAIPADDEIYYTNGSITEATAPSNAFDANIVSNTYDAAKGCWVIKFDNDITTIGERAFYDRSTLTKVTLPSSITSIGANAFYKCSGLTSIAIPDNVTSIGNYAFSQCTSLTDIDLSDKLSSIGEYAFSSCTSLTDIYLPDSITSIGIAAFGYCDNLKKITIPDGVSRINKSVFQSCDNLTDIIIGKGVRSIESGAFYNCTSLSAITVPDGVETIKANAFNGCTSLTSISIPDSIVSIDEHAFNNCSSLQRVDIKDLSAWCNIEYQTTTANPLHKGAKLYLNGEEVINLTVPSDVTNLDFALFYGCSSIKTITIGSHVSSIGNRSFAECKNLQSVTCSNGVTEIGYQAFYRCQSLTDFEIPQSVASIGNYAFEECKSLPDITIPNSVTTIGNYAFSSCSSLATVIIGSGVKEIGKSAFNSCALESVYCHADTPPSLGDTKVFTGNSSDLKIYVPESDGDSILNAYKAKYGWSDYASRIYSISQ